MTTCNFDDPYSIAALSCYEKNLASTHNPKFQKFGYKQTNLGDGLNFLQPTNLDEGNHNAYGQYKSSNGNNIGYYDQINPIGFGTGYHKNSYCATNFCNFRPKCTSKDALTDKCELPSKWPCGPGQNCKANFKLTPKSPYGHPQKLTTATNFSTPQYNYQFPIPRGFHTNIPDTLVADAPNVTPKIVKKTPTTKLLPKKEGFIENFNNEYELYIPPIVKNYERLDSM